MSEEEVIKICMEKISKLKYEMVFIFDTFLEGFNSIIKKEKKDIPILDIYPEPEIEVDIPLPEPIPEKDRVVKNQEPEVISR